MVLSLDSYDTLILFLVIDVMRGEFVVLGYTDGGMLGVLLRSTLDVLLRATLIILNDWSDLLT